MSCAKWLFGYPNDIFVETGTGGGGGVDYALKYGFKKVYSIEIDQSKYDFCVNKYSKNKSVHLYCGDSLVFLPKILSEIKERATFLLDAHITNFKQPHGKMVCPLLEELRMVVNHSLNLGIKHKIIIDDVKSLNGYEGCFEGIKISDVEKTIKSIDHSYIIKVGRRGISAT